MTWRSHSAGVLGLFFAPILLNASGDGLVINETYYNVLPQGGNQYIELFNAGTNTTFLDGKIISDEAGSGTEGIFQFPGFPGETNHPVAPGAYVLIAVDATGATATADWECYAGLSDSDNPLVPNLSLVTGNADLGLFSGGDNVILADGTDITPPINPTTILDGVNFSGGNGELAYIGPGVLEMDGNLVSPTGFSVGRCPDGADNNISSVSDFSVMTLTPKAPNNCLFPVFNIFSSNITEGNSGNSTAQVMVTISTTTAIPASVSFSASNGAALAGSDYIATNGLLQFSGTVQTQFIRVLILGDISFEGDEQFTIQLASPTNAILGTATATITILDDDSPAFTSAFVAIRGFAPSITNQWTSVSGRTYQVQSSSSLLNPIWLQLGPVVTATSATASMVDTNSPTTQRFYRVIQLD